MAEEIIIDKPIELEITNDKYKYEDLEVDIKSVIDGTIHKVVVALKDKGLSQEINGTNIRSFIGKAKTELREVALAEKELGVE